MLETHKYYEVVSANRLVVYIKNRESLKAITLNI
jgi:hypothetical protein